MYDGQGIDDTTERYEDTGTATFLTPENKTFPYKEVYTPLHPHTSQNGQPLPDFRLVRILAGSGESDIRCELYPASFASRHSYEALSYCAGDPADCRSILLNGVSFNTFLSTHEALQQFRAPDHDRIFWIDQICINQKDIQERDSQVRLMRHIYENATKTQVWLGRPAVNPPTRLVFDYVYEFMENRGYALRDYIKFKHGTESGIATQGADDQRSYLRAAARFHRYYNPGRTLRGERIQMWKRSHGLHSTSTWINQKITDMENGDLWLAFDELFRRPWWLRCWVVQEVVVSRNVALVCGHHSVSWDDMALCLTGHFYTTWFFTGSDDLGSLPERLDKCYGPVRLIDVIRQTASRPLYVCLNALRVKSAGDARDKVFAALGMLSDAGKNLDIIPGYTSSNSVIDVYRAAAAAVLSDPKEVHALEDVSGYERAVGLPSWASDLGQPRNQLSEIAGRFQAGRRSEGWINISSDKVRIQVRGWSMDSVAHLGAVDSEPDATLVYNDWKAIFDQQHLSTLNDTHDLSRQFVLTVSMDERMHEIYDSDPLDWQAELKMTARDPERDSKGMRLFISSHGTPGMCLPHAREGQEIFIPFGCSVPLLIQKISDQARTEYEIIGPCYLHGMMYGEVQEQEKRGEARVVDITFV